MKIQVVLYASLAGLLPPGSSGNTAVMNVESDCTVEKLLDSLQVPADSPKVIFVNGRHAKPEQRLLENDRLAVFPPIAGG
jgi:sulfur carrier protein ThiS